MKKCCWLYANEKLNTYSACFIGKTIDELVDDFNKEVNNPEPLTQDRAYYREALLQAIEEKGIDTAPITDSTIAGTTINFTHPIACNHETRELEILK